MSRIIKVVKSDQQLVDDTINVKSTNPFIKTPLELPKSLDKQKYETNTFLCTIESMEACNIQFSFENSDSKIPLIYYSVKVNDDLFNLDYYLRSSSVNSFSINFCNKIDVQRSIELSILLVYN